jgi:glucose/arabinose dehydrogenase
MKVTVFLEQNRRFHTTTSIIGNQRTMMQPMSRNALISLFCLWLLSAVTTQPLHAQTRQFVLLPGFVQETLASDLGPATAFAIAPDGRILFARKGGSVKIFRDGALLPGPFIDLSGEINRYADRGLMGIAIHPNFPNPAYVYFAYTYEPPEARGHEPGGARIGQVLRVEADTANLDKHRAGSERVILGANGSFATMGNPDRGDRAPFSCSAEDGSFVRDCLPVDGPSHTVNGLAFGPDGALYVSTGDATLQPEINVRAIDIDSLAGKILRIDPLTGHGYASNPFYDGDPTSNRSKVFALGLRNPFRFTFEPGSGQVVVGDVGGERWEEINRGGPGANFGWPCYEGPDRLSSQPECVDLFNGVRPVTHALYRYPHAGMAGAAIGGVYYTSDRFPPPYRGAYFFADHNRAALLYLPAGGEGDAREFATNAVALVQIAMGVDGALYLLSFHDGVLSRIRYVGGDNRPPQASVFAEPASGLPPLRVSFSSAGSRDPDGDALTFHWRFGDGQESRTANPSHTYERAGEYVAQLTVTDAAGATATASTTVYVGGHAPVVRILSPIHESYWPVGAGVELRGEANDAEDGKLTGSRMRWDAALHHNEHAHPDYFAGAGESTRLVFPAHGDNSYLELCLTATDATGLVGRTCVNLRQTADTVPTAASESQSGGAGTGTILRERWTSIGGSTVADLTGSSRYPDQPDVVDYPAGIDSAGLGKDYGQRLRGFLHPPVDGEYRFWLASDDSSELWLSPNADSANARLIAWVATWSGRHQWEKLAGQASAPVTLSAGQRYYLEIRHKQADQKDNLSVAWQVPGQERTMLDGHYLSALER